MVKNDASRCFVRIIKFVSILYSTGFRQPTRVPYRYQTGTGTKCSRSGHTSSRLRECGLQDFTEKSNAFFSNCQFSANMLHKRSRLRRRCVLYFCCVALFFLQRFLVRSGGFRVDLYWINSEDAHQRRIEMETHIFRHKQSEGTISLAQRVPAWTTSEVQAGVDRGKVQLHSFTLITESINKDADHLASKYTLPEIACLLSHIRAVETAWRAGSQHALVLEDDMRVDALLFEELSQLLAQLPPGWESLQLTTGNPLVYERFVRMKYPTVLRWVPQHWCTGAILYNRAGMRSILEHFVRSHVYHLGERGVVVADEAIFYHSRSFSYFSNFVRHQGNVSTVQGGIPSYLLEERQKRLNAFYEIQKSQSKIEPHFCRHAIAFLTGNTLKFTTLEENIVVLHRFCPLWEIHVSVQTEHEVNVNRRKFSQGAGRFVRAHFHQSKLGELHLWEHIVNQMKHVNEVLLIAEDISLHGFAFNELLHLSENAVIVGTLRQSIGHTRYSQLVSHPAYTGYDENMWWDAVFPSRSFAFDHLRHSVTLLRGRFAHWYFNQILNTLCSSHHRVMNHIPITLLELTWCGAAREWRADHWNSLDVTEIPTACKLAILTAVTTSAEREVQTVHERYATLERKYEQYFVSSKKLYQWSIPTLEHISRWGRGKIPSPKFIQSFGSSTASESKVRIPVVRISHGRRCVVIRNNRDAWCVPAVYEEQKPCNLTWSQVKGSFVRRQSAVLDSDPYWLSQFTQFTSLSSDPINSAKIFAAHLNALRSLCSTAHEIGAVHGIVLEDDASVTPYHGSLWTYLPNLLREFPEVTSFNLSPSMRLCGSSGKTRLAAAKNGLYFTQHDFGSWGAVAIAYNLNKACSRTYLQAMERLIGCVPTDAALYSGAAGHISADAVLPLFVVDSRKFRYSTHRSDEVHKELMTAYEEAHHTWQVLYQNRSEFSQTLKTTYKSSLLSPLKICTTQGTTIPVRQLRRRRRRQRQMKSLMRASVVGLCFFFIFWRKTLSKVS